MKCLVFILFFTVGCQATKLGKTPKAKPGNLKSRKGKKPRRRTTGAQKDQAGGKDLQAGGRKKLISVKFAYQGDSIFVEGLESWSIKDWKIEIANKTTALSLEQGWQQIGADTPDLQAFSMFFKVGKEFIDDDESQVLKVNKVTIELVEPLGKEGSQSIDRSVEPLSPNGAPVRAVVFELAKKVNGAPVRAVVFEFAKKVNKSPYIGKIVVNGSRLPLSRKFPNFSEIATVHAIFKNES